MTEVDESLLTLAQLREVLHGDLDAAHPLHEHAGVIEDDQHRAVLSFLESFDDSFGSTPLGTVITGKMATDAATSAVFDELAGLASHLVGITETEYDASPLQLTLDLLEHLHNNDAPAFVTAAGNPNTGKTNTMIKLIELYHSASSTIPDFADDLYVLSNLRSWRGADETVTSMHDLMMALLDLRDRPKAVLIDEASTHFDSRTNRHPVSAQWTPAAKRFAKVGVEIVGLIGHTGKDLHPEVKRLTTLAYIKHSKAEAEFYERWPADSDQPADLAFDGTLEAVPKAEGYEPDDAAPWAWDLRQEVFSNDLGWSELRDELADLGPAD